MTPHSQNIKFAPNVWVCSPDDMLPLFHVHREEARRMIRDGQAVPGPRKTITLTATTRHLPTKPRTPASIRDYAGRPTTFRERLLEPCDGREVAVGVVLQLRHIRADAWPIYRAAVVDCLPASKKAAIRELFA